MARQCGKSYPLCHSPSNSTEALNQRTGRIWMKFLSSTNSSRSFTMEHGQKVQPRIRLGASFRKICLKEIPFKDLMVITKEWNPTRKFRLLEERATRIRDNQATIQAIEE
ncbi:hypothetical protein O181_064059 [Austropuccinia psidii MF-1]|uniref:Uncharacterized protein n=1 Tax=Austropuccinia psidii MF-1 TaxID=1389203 RepID=A0A9Q3ENM8_9BASI|nr:hypothetical protein [Austropuccinia psidii MF-1]